MLVSILLPTRQRFNRLKQAVSSFLNLASDPNQIELILKIDEDDLATQAHLNELKVFEQLKIIVGPRGNGYLDLWRFYNMTACLAKGAWLWMFNDDARMMTPKWDEQLVKIGINPAKEYKCLFPLVDAPDHKHENPEWYASFTRHRHYDFPMITRPAYAALGCYSISPANDTFWVEMSQRLGIMMLTDAICVGHSYVRDEVHPHEVIDNAAVMARHNEPDIREATELAIEKIRLAMNNGAA